MALTLIRNQNKDTKQCWQILHATFLFANDDSFRLTRQLHIRLQIVCIRSGYQYCLLTICSPRKRREFSTCENLEMMSEHKIWSQSVFVSWDGRWVLSSRCDGTHAVRSSANYGRWMIDTSEKAMVGNVIRVKEKKKEKRSEPGVES